MVINFECPACQKVYSVAAELAGKTSQCGCGHQFVIPTQSTHEHLVNPQPSSQLAPLKNALGVNTDLWEAQTTASTFEYNSNPLLSAQAVDTERNVPESAIQATQMKNKGSSNKLIVVSTVFILIIGVITICFIASDDGVTDSTGMLSVSSADVNGSRSENKTSTRSTGKPQDINRSEVPGSASPAGSDENESVENSIGIRFVKIPALPDAGSRPFFMSVFEVTQLQYQEIMGEFDFPFKGDNKPAHHMRWYDADEFCRRLSNLPAEKNSGRRYRLPRGDEWIHACRAGKETRYSFGDDETLFAEHAVFGRMLQDGPLQIGTKLPNPWGLYDMHGNVWEWCLDQRTLNADEVDEIRRNNPEQLGRNQRKVVHKRHCGGSWHHDIGMLHWNVTGGNQPHGNILDCGIRLIMEASQDLNATNFIEEHSAETLRNSAGAIIGLQLANKGLTDNDLKCLQSFNRLQLLFLDDNPITDMSIPHLIKHSDLRLLRMRGSRITDQGVAKLAGLKLVDLSLDNTTVTDEALKSLTAMPSLETLWLDNTRITEEGLKHLIKLPKLRYLCVNSSQITDRGIQTISEISGLTMLEMNDTEITDDGIQSIGKLKELKRFWGANTKVSDDGVRALSGLIELRELLLRGTEVTDASIPYFNKLARLEQLDISGTKVSDVGLSRLSVPSLKQIDLRGTNVSAAGVEEFRTRHQKLENLRR